MNPAFSVIFFTTASGAGYGIWFLLGLRCLFSPTMLGKMEAAALAMIGFVLVSAGLISSLSHLGHPERFWRAVTQWRSSWLSREGIASLITYLPTLLLLLLFWRDEIGTNLRAIGGLLALFSLITVYCTARIYTSLKTIRAWHNQYVLPNYLLLGLMTGAIWSWFISACFGRKLSYFAGLLLLTMIGVAFIGKLFYWRFIRTNSAISTIESATGLGRFGKVRSFERPHTEENYLLKEMGFALGRKHAEQLRHYAILLAFLVPMMMVGLELIFPIFGLLWALIATFCVSVGVCVERWLFFAEAKHVVMLYY